MDVNNTPYDDVFRTLMYDCRRLVFPLINEVFGEHYTGKEKIVYGKNEIFLNQQRGRQEKRITDSSFRILGTFPKKYHIECQSTTDSSLVVRFFEYDTQIALEDAELQNSILRVTFPHSAVLYLRSNENTGNTLTIEMNTPGGTVSYNVIIFKIKDYTIEEIFEKRLYILIPFYLFNFEKNFKMYEENAEYFTIFQNNYRHIQKNLEFLCNQNELSEYEYRTLLNMITKVSEHLLQNYSTMKKGVTNIMGGQILDYPAKRILMQGVEQGLKEGLEEGRIMEIIDTGIEFGLSEDEILNRIQKKISITEEQAKMYMEKYMKK